MSPREGTLECGTLRLSMLSARVEEVASLRLKHNIWYLSMPLTRAKEVSGLRLHSSAASHTHACYDPEPRKFLGLGYARAQQTMLDVAKVMEKK